MSSEWSPEKYPAEYLAGFTMLSDQAAVSRMSNYLRGNDSLSMILAETDDPGTIVYSLDLTGESLSSSQLNWADPRKMPTHYDTYASRFHRFYGPTEQQIKRADLLAQDLGVTFGNVDLRELPLSYLDHGKLLETFAWELRSKREPTPSVPIEPIPARTYTLKTISGAFAAMAIENSMNKGHSLEIPSMGMTTVRILAPKLPTPI